MKKILSVLTLLMLIVTLSAGDIAAQGNGSKRIPKKEWLKEMRNYKTSYLTKNLKLSSDQAEKFFPLLYAMEDEIGKLQQQTRQMSKKVQEGKSESELETQKAIEAVYELKLKEGEIELRYLPKFREILSPQQLLDLKRYDAKFTRELMKQHNHSRQKKNK